jgi:hypothetical protein
MLYKGFGLLESMPSATPAANRKISGKLTSVLVIGRPPLRCMSLAHKSYAGVLKMAFPVVPLWAKLAALWIGKKGLILVAAKVYGIPRLYRKSQHAVRCVMTMLFYVLNCITIFCGFCGGPVPSCPHIIQIENNLYDLVRE